MKAVALSLLVISLFLSSCTDAPTRPSRGGAQGAVGGGEQNPGATVVIGKDGSPIKASGKLSIGLAAQTTASSFPRLSHGQWENAVKDLLQLSSLPGQSKNFPDDPGGSVFGNNGALFSVTADQWTAYRNAAEIMGDKIGRDAASYQKLIPAEAKDNKAIVTAFLRRAYRRPATEEEVTSMLAIFDNGRSLTGISDAKGAGFAAMIATVLQSPLFIYRIDRKSVV